MMKKVLLCAALAAMCLACAACGNETIESPGEKRVATSDLVMDLGDKTFLGYGSHAYGGIDDRTVVLYFWPANDDSSVFIRLNIPLDKAVGTEVAVTKASRFVIKKVEPGKMTITLTKLD